MTVSLDELLKNAKTELIPPGMKKAARPPRPPKPPREPLPPRMPRRPPPVSRERAPMSARQALVRSILVIVGAVIFGFTANVTVLSQVQHLVAQQRLSNEFVEELAAGTAPVSEGDYNDVLLPDGAPVAVLTIPSLGVREVVVEGTSGETLKSGPGHRRDTVLPGQSGVSIIFGRAAAFGGPFARIQELSPGDRFSVRTGQGNQFFSVIGVRYAGDPSPAPPAAGVSRLILETARGAAFAPTGVARVDAQLIGSAKPAGTRQTTFTALPASNRELASDPSTAWALVFALQFLIAVEIAAVWSFRRIGAQKTWVVFVPLTLLAGLYVANQLTTLLPNLL